MEYLLDINNIDENTLNNITLHSPTPIQGGSYLAKTTLNGNPILFQMPQCTTKRGIATSGKRYYCDLLFNYDHNKVIEFIENLETVVRDKILDKNELWFQDPPSLEDIEYNWNDSIKQTKQNFYLRTYVGSVKNVNNSVSVYDSNQNKISIDLVKPNSNIITIVEITGLKFSSSSFHINYCLRQIMLLEEKKPLFNKCLINFSKPSTSQKMVDKDLDNDDNLSDKNSSSELTEPKLTIETEKSNSLEETSNLVTDESENTNILNSETEKTDNVEETEKTDNVVETEKTDNVEETEKTDNVEETEKTDNVEETDNVDNDLEILSPETNKNSDMIDSHEQYPDSESEQEITNDRQHLEKTVKNENNPIIENNTLDTLDIKEVDLQIPEEDEMFQLKKPDTVYLDIYRQALEKAKDAKIKAIQAYLELKEIKNKYMIEEIDEDDENFNELTIDF
jgi:hypothetical protein